MKPFLKFSPFALLLFFAVACGDGNKSNDRENTNEIAEEANEEKFPERDNRKDADFVAEQVAATYTEIQMAQLASQRSANAEIKKIAKMLETDHSKTLKQFQDFASKKSITVPNEPEDSQKRKIEDLRTTKEIDNFNRDWCKEMMDKHEKSIEKYQDKIDNTEDADLKGMLSQALPTLRTHYDQLKACHEKLKDAKK